MVATGSAARRKIGACIKRGKSFSSVDLVKKHQTCFMCDVLVQESQSVVVAEQTGSCLSPNTPLEISPPLKIAYPKTKNPSPIVMLFILSKYLVDATKLWNKYCVKD